MARRHARARLRARPVRPPGATAGPGIQPLGLGSQRDGVVYAPPSYQAGRPAPLILTLHGAGGSARRSLPRLQPLADEHGLLLLSIDARDRTWDVVLRGYGPDVAFIEAALAQTFSRYTVDPGRLAVEGFSDGASYALGLGLSNGDLFTHVLAFSPGFVPLVEDEGLPRVFISHGTGDPVLPIEQCSRRIVPELRRRRYDVRYVEFEGGHVVPPAIAREGLGWFLQESRVEGQVSRLPLLDS
ncbi:MAG: phospholipase [Gemmatimonadales bacterium]|nr:phospholipase [Gemmatimonadales bacterium]